MEQYIKLDLNKWLKVLRRLELLPRPMGQDWSEVWLQRFSGTVTVWPKSVLSDFYYILSDPSPQRLAHMIHEGQQSTFPAIKFIQNRMKLEKVIEEGLMRGYNVGTNGASGLDVRRRIPLQTQLDGTPKAYDFGNHTVDFLTDQRHGSHSSQDGVDEMRPARAMHSSVPRPGHSSLQRRNSMMEELRRQSAVFFDDTDDTANSD